MRGLAKKIGKAKPRIVRKEDSLEATVASKQKQLPPRRFQASPRLRAHAQGYCAVFSLLDVLFKTSLWHVRDLLPARGLDLTDFEIGKKR
jgi:hypothetical protein